MNHEDKLRDALRADAPAASAISNDWDDIRGRAHTLRVRHRFAASTVALLAVVAIAVGVLAATGTFNDDASRSIVATPTPTDDQGDIVAALDHSIVVLSSTDGHVVRTLVDGLGTVGALTVSPDGATVYYARGSRTCPDGRSLGAGGISSVSLIGADPKDVLGGAINPLVSPDGRWMAYALASCDAPAGIHIGVLDLSNHAAYWPLDGTTDNGAALPLSWSADSQSLLYLGGDGDVFRLDGIPTPPDPPVNLTTGIGPVSTGTFTHEGKVLIARQDANTYVVQHFDPVPRGIDIRVVGDGPSPDAMTFDTGDRLLLHSTNGALFVQQGSEPSSFTYIAGQTNAFSPRLLRSGVHGAAWLPVARAAPTTSTTTPSTTTPSTTTSTTSTAPSPSTAGLSDAHALVVDASGAVIFSKPYAHQVMRRDADGQLQLVAGTGVAGSSGDGGPATLACLERPVGLALSHDGTLYIADVDANRVRAIAPDGTISTVAGGGNGARQGDGGPATQAILTGPVSVAVSPGGNLYIAEGDGIRHVKDGVITTVIRAGPGSIDVNGQPTNLDPDAVAVDAQGNLFVGNFSPKMLHEFGPDGTLLRSWDIYVSNAGLAHDPTRNILIADYGFQLSRITSGGQLETLHQFVKDAIPGLVGAFRPTGVAAAPDGSIYMTDDGRGSGSTGGLIKIQPDQKITLLTG